MYKMKLNLGDWSDDGHGKYDTYVFECNYDVHDVRQAYKDSCKLTGIQFNHGNKYVDVGYGNYHEVWTDYQDSSISEEVLEIFKKYGIEVEEDDGYCYNPEDIIMQFIGLSLDNFVYNSTKIEIPNINGFWNNELNHQFGYGLFD